MSRLTARMSPISRSLSASITAFSISIEAVLDLVGLGPIVIHHRIDDPMQQRHRALGQDMAGALAQLGDVRDAPTPSVVDRHQVVRAEEEVGFVGVEGVFLAVEVDAVEHEVEVVAVGLDLRLGLPPSADSIARSWKRKTSVKTRPFLVGRLRQIDPDRAAALRRRSQSGSMARSFRAWRRSRARRPGSSRRAQLHLSRAVAEPRLTAQRRENRVDRDHLEPAAVLPDRRPRPLQRLLPLAEGARQVGELERRDVGSRRRRAAERVEDLLRGAAGGRASACT